MLNPTGSGVEPTRRRWFLAALLAGALLRAAALPLGGTGDVTVWKVWSFAAAHDVTAMYGIGGSPPVRRVVHWNGEGLTVDYPPVALYELSLVGRAYRAWDPVFRDSAALNAFVKLPGVLLEIALMALVLSWGWRQYGPRAAMWTSAALWLNPATLIDGPVLGYLDPLMFVPAVVAVVAAWAGSPWLAGACAAIAVLSKPQAIFVIPVIIAVVMRQGSSPWKALVAFAGAGTAAAAVALLPFVLRGALPNMLQALGRLAAHDMLSAQAANVWWIVTWLIRIADSVRDWGWQRALTQEVRILGIGPAMAAGYPNARTIGTVLVAIALAFAVWRTAKARSLADAAALAAWSVYAYAMLGAQVHENHLVAAIPILAVAGGVDRRFRAVFWSLTIVAALNLYLFYGLAPGLPSIISRRLTVIDVTVVLSFVNVCVFVWFTRLLVRQPAAAAAAR